MDAPMKDEGHIHDNDQCKIQCVHNDQCKIQFVHNDQWEMACSHCGQKSLWTKSVLCDKPRNTRAEYTLFYKNIIF